MVKHIKLKMFWMSIRFPPRQAEDTAQWTLRKHHTRSRQTGKARDCGTFDGHLTTLLKEKQQPEVANRWLGVSDTLEGGVWFASNGVCPPGYSFEFSPIGIPLTCPGSKYHEPHKLLGSPLCFQKAPENQALWRAHKSQVRKEKRATQTFLCHTDDGGILVYERLCSWDNTKSFCTFQRTQQPGFAVCCLIFRPNLWDFCTQILLHANYLRNSKLSQKLCKTLETKIWP